MRKKIIEPGSEVSHADSTLGARLRIARIRAGLYLSAAAKEVEMSKQAVGYWEIDRSEPPVSSLQKLAKLYKTNLIWLITGQGETGWTAPAAAHSDRQAELLNTVRTMQAAGFKVVKISLSEISIEIEMPSSAAVDKPVDNHVDNLDEHNRGTIFDNE